MLDNVREDILRFRESSEASIRTLVAGLLSQGFHAILVYRFFNWCYRHSIPTQPFRFIIERFIEITTGISIPAQCKIGKGFRIHHFGGVIFHSSVQIGDHCTVYQGVTIGDRGGYGSAAKLGNNVLVGAGAIILGDITIGDSCTIGANAVVTKNMPAGTTAYGSPTTYKQNSPPSINECR